MNKSTTNLERNRSRMDFLAEPASWTKKCVPIYSRVFRRPAPSALAPVPSLAGSSRMPINSERRCNESQQVTGVPLCVRVGGWGGFEVAL